MLRRRIMPSNYYVFLGWALFSYLGLALLEPSLGNGPKETEARKKKEAQLLKKLQAQFQKWDKNKDGVLDKSELAVAFRGAQAKPYDAIKVPIVTPTTSTTSTTKTLPLKTKDRLVALALFCFPQPSLPANLAMAEVMGRPKTSTTSTTTVSNPVQPPLPNYTLFGDFQFLNQVSNNNKQISKKDFDTWARKYVHLVERLDELNHEVKQAQQKVHHAKNAKAKSAAQHDLARHIQEKDQVNAQWQAIPSAIHQAFHLK